MNMPTFYPVCQIWSPYSAMMFLCVMLMMTWTKITFVFSTCCIYGFLCGGGYILLKMDDGSLSAMELELRILMRKLLCLNNFHF